MRAWSWTRPTASSCPPSASRSEWEPFTCCTVCTGVRQPRHRSRFGTCLVLLLASLPGSWLRFWVLQVRVALKDWDDIKRFEKDAADARHLDAVYILRQLMMQKAFFFVAMPTQVPAGLRRQSDPSVPAGLTSCSSVLSSPSTRRGRCRGPCSPRPSWRRRPALRSWSAWSCWRWAPASCFLLPAPRRC